MPDRIRIGLAGLGVHGIRYANHLLAGDVPDAELHAVCRRDADAGAAWAAAHGLRFHPDPASLALDPSVDAVVVVLPPDRHAAAVADVLAAGKPVLVEKPLCTTLDEAIGIARVVARRSGFLSIAFTLRYDALILRLRELARRLGAWRVLSLQQRFEPFHREWIDADGPGGLWINTAVHGLDLMRFLTGSEVVELSAVEDRVETVRTEDRVAVWARLEPGGVLAVLENDRTAGGRSGRIEWVGADGQLAGDHVHRTLEAFRGRAREVLPEVPANPTVRDVLNGFTEALRAGGPPPVPVEDGLESMRLIEACRRSARTRAVVRMDSVPR